MNDITNYSIEAYLSTLDGFNSAKYHYTLALERRAAMYAKVKELRKKDEDAAVPADGGSKQRPEKRERPSPGEE